MVGNLVGRVAVVAFAEARILLLDQFELEIGLVNSQGVGTIMFFAARKVFISPLYRDPGTVVQLTGFTISRILKR